MTYHPITAAGVALSMLTSVSFAEKEAWAPASETASIEWTAAIPEDVEPLVAISATVLVGLQVHVATHWGGATFLR